MKIVKTLLFAGTALLLLGLSVRLVWLASKTETGLQTLTLQWRDATVGCVLGKYKPIPSLRFPRHRR